MKPSSRFGHARSSALRAQADRANLPTASGPSAPICSPGATRNGISLGVPEGWDGRILFLEPTGRHGVIFQVANFTLPTNAGLEPPSRLPPGEEDPIKAMSENDVLVTVIDGAAGGGRLPTPLTLEVLHAVQGPQVPRGHALATGAFCSGVRCVSVDVDFGSTQPTPDLERRVNEVLASLIVRD